LHEEVAVARVDVPVDVADLVARRVATVVVELQGRALARGEPVGPVVPGQGAPREQIEGFEGLEELGVERHGGDDNTANGPIQPLPGTYTFEGIRVIRRPLLRLLF